MKIIQIKCQGCGASLSLSSGEEIICEFCGAHNYIDDEVIRVEHKVINTEIDNKINNAMYILSEFKDVHGAYKEFLSLSKLAPSDLRVWKGLILSYTNFFDFDVMLNVDWDYLFDLINKYNITGKGYELKDFDGLILNFLEKILNDNSRKYLLTKNVIFNKVYSSNRYSSNPNFMYLFLRYKTNDFNVMSLSPENVKFVKNYVDEYLELVKNDEKRINDPNICKLIEDFKMYKIFFYLIILALFVLLFVVPFYLRMIGS